MTEKRFTIKGTWGKSLNRLKGVICDNNKDMYITDVVYLLNELHEKNNELRLQLNLCSDQRNEFHRGVRENANRVGKLEKENEQLKKDCTVLIYHNQDYRKENEQLKQFQDRVFSWIDMHLQRLPTLRDDEFESDNEFADPSLYSGALQILETMKKELKGDME